MEAAVIIAVAAAASSVQRSITVAEVAERRLPKPR